MTTYFPLRTLAIAAGVALALGAVPARASAELLLTPFAGVSFADDVKKGNYGVTLGLGGIIGVEVDISQTRLGSFLDIPFVDVSAKATTIMGNLVVRLPTGPIQPYVSGGVGVIKLSADVDVPFLGNVVGVDAKDFAMNAGGGLYVFPSPNLGIRGDIRYFRTVDDLALDELTDIDGLDDLPLPRLDFWRITGGITLKF
jgi:opacity protein-like surface antigen